MDRYNPMETPDPTEWLAMDEGERMALVERSHKKLRARIPGFDLHVMVHSIVETQVAMGDEMPARETLDRLRAEGLDRHEAIHAIGLVLGEHLHDLAAIGTAGGYEGYCRQLRAMTAKEWRSMGEE